MIDLWHSTYTVQSCMTVASSAPINAHPAAATAPWPVFPPFSCRFPALNRLVTSAHASTLDSIIIRGWQLQGDYTLRLSTFLQQLQELSSVQHLVLTLPCIGAAAAALGKLQHLRSLRMCTDVSHDSEVSSILWNWFGAEGTAWTKYLHHDMLHVVHPASALGCWLKPVQ